MPAVPSQLSSVLSSERRAEEACGVSGTLQFDGVVAIDGHTSSAGDPHGGVVGPTTPPWPPRSAPS